MRGAHTPHTVSCATDQSSFGSDQRDNMSHGSTGSVPRDPTESSNGSYVMPCLWDIAHKRFLDTQKEQENEVIEFCYQSFNFTNFAPNCTKMYMLFCHH